MKTYKDEKGEYIIVYDPKKQRSNFNIENCLYVLGAIGLILLAII